MTLMYDSSNERHVSAHELELLPVPAARGSRHCPYGFGQYANDIKEAMDINGIQVNQEEYVVSKDNNRMFGTMAIAPKRGELITASEWELLVGVRGSHDQRIPRGLSIGSNVFVCSNLMFSGDLGTFKTKQTTNIARRLPTLIGDAIKRIPEMAHQQEVKYNTFQQMEFKPRWGDAALIEVHRRGGLSAAQLGVAVKEWDQPSYEEHAQFGFSAWRFMNACTEALKPRGDNANHQIIADRSAVVDRFLCEVANIKQVN